ncbi:MAG TPA: hypothetical protein VFR46_04180 [Actinomycetes bacterium]|nr:hypothetical protein [Actinomycetes bacterium]
MIQQLRRPRAWTAGQLEHIANCSKLLDRRVQLPLGTDPRDDTVEVVVCTGAVVGDLLVQQLILPSTLLIVPDR